MKFADYLTDIADILASSADSGEIRVNIGNVASGAGFDSDVPVYGPDGFISRPNDPDGDGAAFAFWVHDGHQRRVLGTKDNRFAEQAGTLDPGDRVICTKGAPRVLVKQVRQAISLYTEMANAPATGGKSMLVDLDGSNGMIILRAGGAQIILDGQAGTITLIAAGPAGAATIVMDGAAGISAKAGVFNIDCPFSTLGLNSDGTRPGKAGVDTVCIGAMGQSAIASVKCYAPAY